MQKSQKINIILLVILISFLVGGGIFTYNNLQIEKHLRPQEMTVNGKEYKLKNNVTDYLIEVDTFNINSRGSACIQPYTIEFEVGAKVDGIINIQEGATGATLHWTIRYKGMSRVYYFTIAPKEPIKVAEICK